jgi:hypothetical protein
VDFLTGYITVRRSKNGHTRRVPMNATVRSALMDLAGQRARSDDPSERVFPCTYTQADKFFPRAVERPRERSRKLGRTPAAWTATPGTATATRSPADS